VAAQGSNVGSFTVTSGTGTISQDFEDVLATGQYYELTVYAAPKAASSPLRLELQDHSGNVIFGR
jgi:hypothetical protein